MKKWPYPVTYVTKKTTFSLTNFDHIFGILNFITFCGHDTNQNFSSVMQKFMEVLLVLNFAELL